MKDENRNVFIYFFRVGFSCNIRILFALYCTWSAFINWIVSSSKSFLCSSKSPDDGGNEGQTHVHQAGPLHDGAWVIRCVSRNDNVWCQKAKKKKKKRHVNIDPCSPPHECTKTNRFNKRQFLLSHFLLDCCIFLVSFSCLIFESLRSYNKKTSTGSSQTLYD